MPDELDPTEQQLSEPFRGERAPSGVRRWALSPGSAGGSGGRGSRWRPALARAAALVVVAGVTAVALNARLHSTGSPAAHPAYAELPSLTGSAIAYDADTQTVILFGGRDGGGAASAQTWSWDGHGWTQLHPVQAPPARSDASLAWDPDLKALVLFGGATAPASQRCAVPPQSSPGLVSPMILRPATPPSGSAGAPVGPSSGTGVPSSVEPSQQCFSQAVLSDTWSFDGASWVGLPTVTRPAVGLASPMAWDAAHHQLVLTSGSLFPAVSSGGASGSGTSSGGVSGSGTSSTGTAGGGTSGSSGTVSGSAGMAPGEPGTTTGVTTAPGAPRVPVVDPTPAGPAPGGGVPGIIRPVPAPVGTYTFDGHDWTGHAGAGGPAPGVRLVSDNAGRVLGVDATSNLCFGPPLGAPQPATGQSPSGVLTCGIAGGAGCGDASTNLADPCMNPGAIACPATATPACNRCPVMGGAAGTVPGICLAPAATPLWAWSGSAWVADTTVKAGPGNVWFATGTPTGVLAVGADGTWTLSGTTWTRQAPLPAGLLAGGGLPGFSAGAWDFATNSAVLVSNGGQGEGQATWTWDGQSWKLAAGSTPSPAAVPSGKPVPSLLPAPGTLPVLPNGAGGGGTTVGGGTPAAASAGPTPKSTPAPRY